MSLFAPTTTCRLFRLRDGGVLDRLQRRWWERGTPCEEPSPYTHLDFTHTITAFLVLLVGFAVALLLLGVEKLCQKYSGQSGKAVVGPLNCRDEETLARKYYDVAADNTIASALSRHLINVEPTDLPKDDTVELETYIFTKSSTKTKHVSLQ